MRLAYLYPVLDDGAEAFTGNSVVGMVVETSDSVAGKIVYADSELKCRKEIDAFFSRYGMYGPMTMEEFIARYDPSNIIVYIPVYPRPSEDLPGKWVPYGSALLMAAEAKEKAKISVAKHSGAAFTSKEVLCTINEEIASTARCIDFMFRTDTLCTQQVRLRISYG